MQGQRSSVTIIGGGVGGLSAAQELAERGFEVTVIEAASKLGGKARSFEYDCDADSPALPGEHGFRFFPGFYTNLRDTMARIPRAGGGTVADNLVPTTETLVTSVDGGESRARSATPRTIREWIDAFQPQIGNGELSMRETNYFLRRLLVMLTSSDRRRERDFDQLTWWEFVNAERKSPAYRKHLAESTQALVAMRPQIASARTIGRIYIQLMLDQIDPGRPTEAVLNGPTTAVWIDPWVDYLESLGVEFRLESPVTAIESDGTRVTGIVVDGDDRITADHYVAAVPVEVMASLVTPELSRAAPSLADIHKLDTAWMNGLQFYLTDDAPLAHGHQAYTDSPWALTSISQGQFWADGPFELTECADGSVEGVLSVIISDWNTPGVLYDKPASECTREELEAEVWEQLVTHLNRESERLSRDAVYDVVIDPAIVPVEGEGRMDNRAPLLINTVGSLRNRPPAVTAAPNLVLAADYVRTESDLATMESANEAARLAVGGIVDRTGIGSKPTVWGIDEPAVFEPLKRQDDIACRLGLPHPGETERGLQQLLRGLKIGIDA